MTSRKWLNSAAEQKEASRILFADNELEPYSVIKKYLITATDGKQYYTNHYNLQMIIAVGFKVNNDRVVQFRKWANHLETRQGEKIFYWPGNLETKTITVYRASANEAERRSIKEIPPEEIACPVKAVLTHQIGLPHAELVRETARLMGFQRIVKGVESTIALGIEYAIKRGWAGVDRSGNVVLGKSGKTGVKKRRWQI